MFAPLFFDKHNLMLPDLPVLLSNSQGEFMSQNNVPGFVAAIGNTPLIRLKAVSELTGCEIYGKAEFMNPGGSVKDRAAKAIIEDAEARGLIGPGGIIVEGTAGNTGIGLTMVGNAKGYKSVIVMPETQSEEKKDVFAASTVALSKSGTVALELSLAKVPIIVTYKVSAQTAWLLRRMVKVKYVNLVNLILDKLVIPEYLQEKCEPAYLTSAIADLLMHPEKRTEQVEAAQKALEQLDDPTSPNTPSEKAANAVLKLINYSDSALQ